MNVADTNKKSGTDWEKLEAMTDEEIDYSDIPPLTDAFFERAKLYRPESKAHLFLQLDADVLNWFKAQDDEYQILINRVLRAYMEVQRQSDSEHSEDARISLGNPYPQ